MAVKTMDAYIRVSRRGGRDGETYLSPTLQREAIERWAEYNNVRIVAWHVDEDWSGGVSSRPGLDAARDRVIAGETGGIVSWKIDRFSRNTVQGLEDLKLLEKHGARLAFVVESLDTSTTTGKMLYTILLAVAEGFLDGIKSSWESALSKAYDRGAHLGGPTPLGYRRIRKGESPNDEQCGLLVIDPETGPLITEAFRLAAEDGFSAATVHLRAAFPQRGRWEADETRRVLNNRAYLGEIRNGDQKRIVHEPLTNAEHFALAQSEPRARATNGDYPLTGTLLCDSCGGKLVGKRDGIYRRYRCQNPECNRRASVNADMLEDWVRDELVRALKVPDFAKTLSPAGIDEARATMQDAERALRRWADDDRTRDAIGESAYFAGLDERSVAAETAHAIYDELIAQSASAELLPSAEELHEPSHFARSLRLVVERITVRRGRGRRGGPDGRDLVVAFRWQRHDLVAGMLPA